MKYKLKKDLPFAKAGDEVVISSSSLILARYKRIQVSNNLQAPVCEVHEDCLSDWIEEIKPREWILEIDIALNGEVSHAVRSANAKGRMLHKDSELVKVREVIE